MAVLEVCMLKVVYSYFVADAQQNGLSLPVSRKFLTSQTLINLAYLISAIYFVTLCLNSGLKSKSEKLHISIKYESFSHWQVSKYTGKLSISLLLLGTTNHIVKLLMNVACVQI
jgi:hypothetical protein